MSDVIFTCSSWLCHVSDVVFSCSSWLCLVSDVVFSCSSWLYLVSDVVFSCSSWLYLVSDVIFSCSSWLYLVSDVVFSCSSWLCLVSEVVFSCLFSISRSIKRVSTKYSNRVAFPFVIGVAMETGVFEVWRWNATRLVAALDRAGYKATEVGVVEVGQRSTLHIDTFVSENARARILTRVRVCV